MNLHERATLVDVLGSALNYGGQSLSQVPALLKQLLSEGAWKEFETSRGEHVTYTRFEDFVTKKPLKGLGADIQLVKNIIRDDKEAVDLLNKALQRPVGNQTGNNQYQSGTVDNVNNSSRPDGNSQGYALRKLRDDRPDLHEKVLAGEVSAHKAMIEAGFRKRSMTVILDSPVSAEKLAEQATPEFIEAFVRAVSGSQAETQ